MKQYLLKVWMTAALSLLALGGVWGQESYTPEYPKVSDITHESAKLKVSASVGGLKLVNPIPVMYGPSHYTSFIVLDANEVEPNIAEVISWSLDGNEELIPEGRYGLIGLSASDTEFSFEAYSLSSETSYVAYFVTTEDFETSVIGATEPTAVPFTTRATPTPLTATLSPADDATNVPVSTSTFEIRFSEDVEMADGVFFVSLFEKGVTRSKRNVELYSDLISGTIVSIDFDFQFLYGKEYKIVFPANAIKSVATGALFPGLSAGEWSFTTEVQPDPLLMKTSSLSPADGSVEVPRAPTLVVSFNQAITWGPTGVLTIHRSDNDATAATISREQIGATISQDQLSIVFSSESLEYGTEYYVIIDEGFVKALNTSAVFAGLSDKEVWTFTTETAPPAWADGYPSISNQTVANFQLDVWADVTGAFYGVLTQSSTQPTAEQIAQGQNSGGSTARIAFNQVVDSIETFSSIEVDFNDQTLLGQSYFLHLVYRSGGTYPKYGEIKTIEIDRIIPTVEKTYPANNSMVFPAPDAIEITFSELVVGTNGEALRDAYFSLVQNSDPEVPIPFVISIVADGERTVITLTPTVGLVDNTAYTLTIKTVYDLSGNPSAASTISFETDGVAQWTGSSSSSWTDAANWGGTLPVDGKSVLIPGSLTNYPLITSETISVHNLTIAPGAVLSHSGGTLNVSGLFHLQSSSDVNASYINTGGDLNATPDSIRVDQVISNIDLTYIISSPTNSSTAANFGSYYPLYRYDNSKDSWEAIPSAMTPGVGYRMWTDDTMVSFTGSFNTGNIEVSLLRTDGKGYGWNFVGNPYPASIDWTELGITEASSVENAFWMWLPGSRAYGSFSAATNIPINILSSKIPSNHGFLVKVKKELGSGSITFLPEAQVGNSTSYLKSASAREVAPHFKLAGVSSSFRDELAIAFVDEATLGLDKFDMEKKFAERKNIFELYSISGEAMSVINALPSADKIEIPLGYNALQTGDYSIEMLSNSEGNASIVLVDKNLGVETSMVVGSKYDFTINEIGKSSSRFTLKIEKVLTSNQEIKNADNSKAVTVFANDGEIFVNQISAGVFNRYSIVDVQGRLVKEGVLSSAIGSKALGAFDKGLYIVSFSNGKDKNVMNSKVVVY